MQPITSRDHPFFKQLVKLGKSARQRKTSGLTLLDGIHLIQAYDAALGSPVSLIMSESGRESAEIKNLLCAIDYERKTKTTILSDALFHQVSPVKTPIGIMALISIPEIKSVSDNKHKAFYILLEAIQDPGNLGSILRSAAAAGVSDVYLSSDCTHAWSPKTLRAAMGAHFLLRIHENSNLVETAQQFHGKIIATSLQAKKHLYQTQLAGPIAFAFGNEGMGLSNELSQVTSEQVTIPMPGKTESLNVAAAAAICLFEKVRQTTNRENTGINN
ncbi:MAG: RNA methyltransferase [Nitrosomonas sp.]|nr:RNA methyltransferase [Nitrosomonas sp.]MDP1951336.1 RNA methyltransferase [Nitrosomonas sp.]